MATKTARDEASGAAAAKDTTLWLRRLCQALPGTGEKGSWGHPNFTDGGKIFAAVDKYKGEWARCYETVGEHQQALVEDSDRFYVAPNVGHQGWVSMRLSHGVFLGELKALVLNSYRLVVPKRMLQVATPLPKKA